MRKIREVLRYKYEHGMSNSRIAGALSIGKGSVHNILERFVKSKLPWPLPPDIKESELESRLYGTSDNPPASKTGVPLPDIAYLERELRRPHVTMQLLFEEYRTNHPNGLGRTQFYEYFAKHKSKRPDMKVIHKGGDKLFIDYSGDGLSFIERSTGERTPVELFVCSWGATSYSYAEGTLTQRTDDFVSSHPRAFEYFGAVPHALVPDNIKSGVTKSCRYDPTLHPLYQRMAEHYGTVIIPARVAHPKDKAVVESNVLHLQRFILGRLRNRTFYNLQEVNAAIWQLLEEFNNRPMKDYGNQSRKQRFEELERPYAKPLPSKRFQITRMRTGVRVAPNYHIRYEDRYYSVPHQLARCRVDVYQVGPIIEIYHDQRHVCRHLINPKKYTYTTKNDHMPPEHAFVKGWSKQYFTTEAEKIGTATAEAVKVIMKRQEHAQQGFNAALGVLRFAKAYSPNRLEKACERALHFNSASYRSIKAILEQNLDTQPLSSPVDTNQQLSLLQHENLRGAGYYSQYQ